MPHEKGTGLIIIDGKIYGTIFKRININYKKLFFPSLFLSMDEHFNIKTNKHMETLISCFYYRIEEEKNILSEFQEDLNKLILWLEETESIIAIPLEPGNEDQLRDCLGKVKVL